jgi:hypothetical protein
MSISFTPDEITTVINAVTTSGMATAIADVGLVSTAIEAAAMSKEIVGASQKYPNNTLIQAAFSPEAIRQNPPAIAKDMTPDNAVDRAIAAIDDAIALATTKATPDEVNEYKQFIYTVADRVANAAGEGLFGSGAQKVSDKEAATLTKLKAALGI